MAQIKVVVKDAPQLHKAEVKLDRSTKGADVIAAALGNWALPNDIDYKLVNTTSGREINATDSLREDLVSEGDVLRLDPAPRGGTL